MPQLLPDQDEYRVLLQRLATLSPPFFVMDGFAEKALFFHRLTGQHADRDVLVMRRPSSHPGSSCTVRSAGRSTGLARAAVRLHLAAALVLEAAPARTWRIATHRPILRDRGEGRHVPAERDEPEVDQECEEATPHHLEEMVEGDGEVLGDRRARALELAVGAEEGALLGGHNRDQDTRDLRQREQPQADGQRPPAPSPTPDRRRQEKGGQKWHIVVHRGFPQRPVVRDAPLLLREPARPAGQQAPALHHILGVGRGFQHGPQRACDQGQAPRVDWRHDHPEQRNGYEIPQELEERARPGGPKRLGESS
jgi:hypothetical protein